MEFVAYHTLAPTILRCLRFLEKLCTPVVRNDNVLNYLNYLSRVSVFRHRIGTTARTRTTSKQPVSHNQIPTVFRI